MTTETLPFEQRFMLRNVSWEDYESLLRGVGDRHVFITYNNGTLELMSPSRKHEHVAEILGVLVRTLAMELDIEISSAGSTTFRREDLAKGLEPDRCFYIQNEAAVRAHDDIDLSVDPPPDLAIEVDITHRSMNREEIYAALGVIELWCWSNDALVVRILDKGRYVLSSTSKVLPMILPAQLERFVRMRGTIGESTLLKMFVKWVREDLRQTGG